MSRRLEDYALIGDGRSAALVGNDGSIDWLCWPRFDSAACLAALLGTRDHGRWLVAPTGAQHTTAHRYRRDTLVLETEFTTADATVRVVDCMPVHDGHPTLLRRVECLVGRIEMRSELVPRFEYGHVVPRLRGTGRRSTAVAGPDRLTLDADIAHHREGDDLLAAFSLVAGEHAEFRLTWSPSRAEPPAPQGGAGEAIAGTERWWRDWARTCRYDGAYRDAVVRSLITLKASQHRPSGGLVAAPTTSLPERLGGELNWDYRYCWIRDATFTLLALLGAGYESEAVAWREWMLRALAGHPEQMQLVYGLEGERHLVEHELVHLPGYAGSRPVRVGNAAVGQFQLDVYGELMDALHQSRTHSIPPKENAWEVQRALVDFLESRWRDPDNGIWEERGRRRHFTHSKVMAWVAVDRAIRGIEQFGLPGPLTDWKRLRAQIVDEVCTRGYDPGRSTFTHYYGSRTPDPALLLIPAVGFLPATDERVRGTVAAVERHLCRAGLVHRNPASGPAGSLDECAFLPCSFWLADAKVLAGRQDEGRELFERLLGLRTGLGLLAEEYDTDAGRLTGNFPQALSHLALVNTALNLAGHGPSHRRAARRTGRA